MCKVLSFSWFVFLEWVNPGVKLSSKVKSVCKLSGDQLVEIQGAEPWERVVVKFYKFLKQLKERLGMGTVSQIVVKLAVIRGSVAVSVPVGAAVVSYRLQSTATCDYELHWSRWPGDYCYGKRNLS